MMLLFLSQIMFGSLRSGEGHTVQKHVPLDDCAGSTDNCTGCKESPENQSRVNQTSKESLFDNSLSQRLEGR